MARQGIKKEQVYSTADALRDEGTAPTVQAVRERLGSGSFSTINTHLSAWKAENAAQAVADIPPMPEKVEASVKQMWVTATRSAQESFETQREALEIVRKEMEREQASMAEEIERLERELEGITAKAAQLETDLTAEHQAGEDKGAQITALSIENARLGEQVKTEKAGTLALKNALDTANTERQRDHATHEQDRKRWEQEIGQERAKGEQERQQWAEQREQEKTLRERQQQELAHERGAREDVQRQAAELKTETARLEERAQAADTRAGEMRGQLEALQEKFAEVAKAQTAEAAPKEKAPSPPSQEP